MNEMRAIIDVLIAGAWLATAAFCAGRAIGAVKGRW
jgi:hypothetical protein